MLLLDIDIDIDIDIHTLTLSGTIADHCCYSFDNKRHLLRDKKNIEMILHKQLQKYQYQQRVLFSSARRRRRKPKLPSTTKDRLRRVDPPPKEHPMKIDAALVTERMQTRLNWIRSNIESLWKDPDATTRPDRYELVMDANWWKWNLLLAVTPGILIATYCELVAKPMMIEKEKSGQAMAFPNQVPIPFWRNCMTA